MATDFSIVWSSSEDITKYTSYFSLPEFMKFPTVIPGQHAYAYFYAPHNHIFQGSSDEKPPLLVRTHGNLSNLCCILMFIVPKAYCMHSVKRKKAYYMLASAKYVLRSFLLSMSAIHCQFSSENIICLKMNSCWSASFLFTLLVLL
jgi:hypothetical protein